MSTTATTRRQGTRRRRGWMHVQPLFADRVNADGARAAIAACTNRKGVADRMGVSADVIDNVCAGAESSRLRRYDEFFVAVDNPYPLIERHETMAMRSHFADWTRAQCEARLEEIRSQLEPIADAKAKAAAMVLQVDCAESRAAWRDTMAHENTLQREAIAITLQLDELDARARGLA